MRSQTVTPTGMDTVPCVRAVRANQLPRRQAIGPPKQMQRLRRRYATKKLALTKRRSGVDLNMATAGLRDPTARATRPNKGLLMRKHIHSDPRLFDYLKMITTLASGAIVLLVTFANKFGVVSGEAAAAFNSALAAFVASIICSLFCMIHSLCNRAANDDKPASSASFTEFLVRGSAVLFIIAIALLAERKRPSV